ncbi:MAG TPA: type II CAAX endopeptidase family protein [Anaerolineales bacterium]|nr:type II CAAX endopeptidase family protein [Anaerolineales bacterium]
MKEQSYKKIAVFVVLTFALSSIFYYLVISTGSFPTSYGLGIMWCPGVAGIVTQLIFNHNLRGMGWKPGRGRYLLASYFLPLAYTFVVYAIIWLVGLGKFDPAALYKFVSEANGPDSTPFGIVGTYVVILLTLGFIVNCVAALGEEIGWRGLLVPELAKTTSFAKTALISGGIWAVWHWPLILSGEYNSTGTPLWFGLICFTIMLIGLNFAFTWLRLKSGSLWTTVLLHAAHNLFIQAFFNHLTSNTGITEYVIDEFGIGLALMAPVLAYLFWRKRQDIEVVDTELPRSRVPEFAPAK